MSTFGNIAPRLPGLYNASNSKQAFYYYCSSAQTNVTGNNTNYTLATAGFTAVFDQGNNFSTTTGQFTAPLTGIYFIQAQIIITGLTSSHTQANVYLLTTAGSTQWVSQVNPFAMSSGGTTTIGVSGTMQLNAFQTVDCVINVAGGTKVVGIYSNGTYSGSNIAGFRVD